MLNLARIWAINPRRPFQFATQLIKRPRAGTAQLEVEASAQFRLIDRFAVLGPPKSLFDPAFAETVDFPVPMPVIRWLHLDNRCHS